MREEQEEQANKGIEHIVMPDNQEDFRVNQTRILCMQVRSDFGNILKSDVGERTLGGGRITVLVAGTMSTGRRVEDRMKVGIGRG